MAYEKLKTESYQNFGGRNRKASLYLTNSSDVLDLVNYDFSIVGSLTRRGGTAVYPPGGASYALTYQIGGLYEFSRLSGASFLVGAFGNLLGTVNPLAPNGFSVFYNPGVIPCVSNNIFTFQTFVDRMFASNGCYFIKWDGFTALNFSLPPGTSLSTLSLTTGSSLPTGDYTYAYGYLNERGYAGPAINTWDFAIIGGTFLNNRPMLTGFTTPANYGITAIIIYRSDTNLKQLFQIDAIAPGSTVYLEPGNGLTLGTFPAPQYLWFTLSPQSMELYNNSLFMAGFSAATTTYFPQQTNTLQSRTYFSDVGQPEGVGTTNWIEYRTNDGDYVSCLKSYYGQLVVGKTKSLFSVQGTNAPYLVSEISDQYGILSPRGAVVYNQTLWFLDEKGICQFDGSNVNIVSQKVEDIFARMNVTAAKQVALMAHIKERNEIWCALPIDGATYNNMTIAHDYITDGWALYQGFNPQSLCNGYGVFPTRTPIIGDNFGFLSYMGSTITTDAYVAQGATMVGGASLGTRSITTSVQFRFEATQFGNATEKLFRRLWVDISPVLGVTYNMTVNFFQDRGMSTIISSMTFAQNSFQYRNEFGIAAKSLSVQLINSDRSALTLNGYVLGYRFQRDL